MVQGYIGGSVIYSWFRDIYIYKWVQGYIVGSEINGGFRDIVGSVIYRRFRIDK